MARHFNGTTDDIISGNLPSTTPTTLTFACWVNGDVVPGTAANTIPIDSRDVAATGDFSFGWGSTAAAQVQSFSAANASQVYSISQITVPATLSISTWYHVAATWDGANLRGYVNGTLQSAQPALASLGWSATMRAIVGAYFPGTPTFFWPGSLADFAIWTIALPASRIAALAAGQRANVVSSVGLMLYWKLDSSNPALDLSPNGLNGTITGTTVVNDPPAFSQLFPTGMVSA